MTSLGFHQAVLLWPPVTLHVAEGWPGFPVWARRFASRAIGPRVRGTHLPTVVPAGAGALVPWRAAGPVLVFVGFAFLP